MSEHDNSTSHTSPTSGRPARCRGRGRRFFAGALGLSLVALVAVVAFRASGQGPHGAFGHGAFGHGVFCAEDAGKHATRMVGWLVDDLKGTPEQEKKLAEIATAAVKDLAPIRADLRDNHLQAVALLTQEPIDRGALESLRARQMALATTASTRLAKALADAAEVLTPAQRVELAERLKKRWG